MNHNRWATVFGAMVIGIAAAAGAGDLVVDGAVATTGGWYEFADGSTQSSAAYPRWAQVAVVDIQGRGDYTDPTTAMAALPAWCGTPSLSNPCLVKILPGWYDIGTSNVVMQPHVDIEGSGRNATFVRAASSAAVVYGANNAELRSLSVINDGVGGFPQGVRVDGAHRSPRITDVDVVVSGIGTGTVGVNLVDSEPVVDSITVRVTGGDTVGIMIANRTAVLRNVDVYVTDGGSAKGIVFTQSAGMVEDADVHVTPVTGGIAVGIELTHESSPLLRDSRVYVSDADHSYGIKSTFSNPLVKGVTVAVERGDQGWGFENHGGTATLANSSIKVLGGWSATGVHADSGNTTLRDVHIDVGEASGSNTGVASGASAQVKIEQVKITANGGVYSYAVDNGGGSDTALINVTAEAKAASTYNWGVVNQDIAVITATNLIAKASGGTGSYGVLNAGTGGTVTVDRSTVTGASSSVRNDNDSAGFFVGTSKLDGPVSTHLTCFGNYDATYTAVTCPQE